MSEKEELRGVARSGNEKVGQWDSLHELKMCKAYRPKLSKGLGDVFGI